MKEPGPNRTPPVRAGGTSPIGYNLLRDGHARGTRQEGVRGRRSPVLNLGRTGTTETADVRPQWTGFVGQRRRGLRENALLEVRRGTKNISPPLRSESRCPIPGQREALRFPSRIREENACPVYGCYRQNIYTRNSMAQCPGDVMKQADSLYHCTGLQSGWPRPQEGGIWHYTAGAQLER